MMRHVVRRAGILPVGLVMALVGAAQPGIGEVVGRRGPVTHTVLMQGNRFVPARLTLAQGDTVAFVMASGGPHNVAFWSDSLPAGAAPALALGVPEPIDTLMGPLLATEGVRYTVVFGEVPVGRYPYYCLPHVGNGMRAEVAVETHQRSR